MTKRVFLIVAGLAMVSSVVLLWWLRPSTSRVEPAVGTSPTAPANGTASPAGEYRAGTSQPPPAAIARNPPADNLSPDSQRVAATGATPRPGTAATGNTPAPPPASQDAMIDLDMTQRSLRDYRTLMGENPVGTNAEIMRALMGGNPRQATLGPAEGQQLNPKGELVDRWGTPYFFHQLSGKSMEIHSAGPDKVLGTDDDLILK